MPRQVEVQDENTYRTPGQAGQEQQTVWLEMQRYHFLHRDDHLQIHTLHGEI